MKQLIICLTLITAFTACQKADNPLDNNKKFQMPSDYASILNAAEKGIQMLEELPSRAAARTINESAIFCKTSSISRSDADTLYYVVNYADSAGFAIVSNNRAQNYPLLAVIEKGSFDPDEQTDNIGFNIFASKLDTYSATAIETTQNIEPLPLIRTKMYYTPWISVAPKLEVNWGQGSRYGFTDCYNYFCPTSGYYRAPTGCVATAVAMIMSYYEWPASISLSYEDRDQNVQALDWETLKQHFDDSNCYGIGDIDDKPLARLMRQIGQLVGMDYDSKDEEGLPIAGAPSEHVPAALQQLGYATTGSLHDYTWENTRSDIDMGHVVYMRGEAYDNNQSKGHAWVVDGYKTQSFITEYYQKNQAGLEVLIDREKYDYNYLHINWGWNGENNGYFASDVLDTNSPQDFDHDAYSNEEDYYFTENLDIITGIRINN